MKQDFKKRVLILIARRLLRDSIRLCLLALLCAARNRNTFANWLLGLAYKILVPAAVGSRYGFRDCKFEFLVRRNAPDTGSSEGIIYHAAEGVTVRAKWKIRIKLRIATRRTRLITTTQSDKLFCYIPNYFPSSLFFHFLNKSLNTWIGLNGKLSLAKIQWDKLFYYYRETLYSVNYSPFFFLQFVGSTHVHNVCLDIEWYIIKLRNTVIRALEIKWFVEPVSAYIRHTM